MHLNSKLLFEKYARQHFRPDLRILEIGPDQLPSSYQQLVGLPSAQWHTIDLADRPGLTFQAKGDYCFPIDDGSYDIVVSGQVLEHVKKVWLWIREVARVCKPGGRVITVNPVTWPYHLAPVDCWRIYPEGMRALYEEGQLEVEHTSWESLEPTSLLPRLPRPQNEHHPGMLFKLARLCRYPLQRAYDTITIGRKAD
ncbi:MAG: methyltransferase domain-containing protein [Planctomycetota bacterium]